MISWRRKDFNSPPAILTEPVRLRALKKAERYTDGEWILSNHYNTTETTLLLKAYSIDQNSFNDDTDLAKCYYCESTTEVVATLQVEHYRPKSRIDDENRVVVPGTKGYYWLGIEWSNLVLSCPKCNGRGAKGNIFTIKGTRIKTGTNFNKTNYVRTTSIADQLPLMDERPDLLHPEIDDAYVFLKFDREGKISHKWRRGRRTIEICKLDRKQLNIARNNLINQYNTSFWEVVGWRRANFISDNQVVNLFRTKCQQLRERHQRKESYTLLVRYMIQDFEIFFVERVPNEFQDQLREAFQLSVTPI